MGPNLARNFSHGYPIWKLPDSLYSFAFEEITVEYIYLSVYQRNNSMELNPDLNDDLRTSCSKDVESNLSTFLNIVNILTILILVISRVPLTSLIGHSPFLIIWMTCLLLHPPQNLLLAWLIIPVFQAKYPQ